MSDRESVSSVLNAIDGRRVPEMARPPSAGGRQVRS